MNFIKKTITIFCSVVTFTSFLSPSAVFAYDKEIPEVEVSYYSYSKSSVEKVVSKLQTNCLFRNNNSEVKKAYDAVVEEYSSFYTAYLLSMIQYYSDYSKSTEFEYLTKYADYCESLIFSALKDAVLNSQYSEYLQSFMEQREIDFLKDNGTAVTTIDFSQKSSELLSEYQAVNANGNYSLETKSTKNADIYLRLIKLYKDSNPFQNKTIMQMLYDQYGRDYTIDEIMSLSDSVKQTTKYLYNYLDTGENNYINKNNVNSKNIPLIPNPMENVVFRYAGQISDELAYSADFLKANSLYSYASGTFTARGQAFTTNLPKYGVPYIFVGSTQTNRDVKSCIHEFGHFTGFSNYPESGKYFNASLNTDIAEVHSQGLEVLFFKFYEDIYGEKNGKYMVYEQTIELLDTLSLGFMMNEFENYVFEHVDEMTAQDVTDLYYRLEDEYKCNIAGYFGNVQNIFLSPGYCISYGISLLPAMELISYIGSDYDKAVELYSNITKKDTYCSKFQSSVAECGFKDPLDSKSLNSLRFSIADYSDSIEGILNGDIDNDNMLSSEDIKKMQHILLEGDNNYDLRKTDTSRDDKIDITDLIYLKNKF